MSLEVYRFKKPSSVSASRTYNGRARPGSSSDVFSAWTISNTTYGFSGITSSDQILAETAASQVSDYSQFTLQSGNSDNILVGDAFAETLDVFEGQGDNDNNRMERFNIRNLTTDDLRFFGFRVKLNQQYVHLLNNVTTELNTDAEYKLGNFTEYSNAFIGNEVAMSI